ncbi:hypothetical protein B0H16DRAFT_1473044 [Mycena metata]|uniref:Uncharacterized protein n=1 Tax=Mycena metata TaxID=1033252 RepID=A0AAD7MMK5_9AGAR|nr:hypothetical protein B0H16DRAFT_1473044 [Mycena metata]
MARSLGAEDGDGMEEEFADPTGHTGRRRARYERLHAVEAVCCVAAPRGTRVAGARPRRVTVYTVYTDKRQGRGVIPGRVRTGSARWSTGHTTRGSWRTADCMRDWALSAPWTRGGISQARSAAAVPAAVPRDHIVHVGARNVPEARAPVRLGVGSSWAAGVRMRGMRAPGWRMRQATNVHVAVLKPQRMIGGDMFASVRPRVQGLGTPRP